MSGNPTSQCRNKAREIQVSPSLLLLCYRNETQIDAGRRFDQFLPENGVSRPDC